MRQRLEELRLLHRGQIAVSIAEMCLLPFGLYGRKMKQWMMLDQENMETLEVSGGRRCSRGCLGRWVVVC